MSDGEEDVSRPPRTPEPWEALTDEEDQVEVNTEKKFQTSTVRTKSDFAN